MRGIIVISFILIVLLLIPACSEEELKAEICKSNNKEPLVKIWCLFQGKEKKTIKCESERMEEFMDICRCKQQYPVRVEDQCFTLREHILNDDDFEFPDYQVYFFPDKSESNLKKEVENEFEENKII